MRLQFGCLHRDGRFAGIHDLNAALPDNTAFLSPEITGEVCDGPLLMAFRGKRLTWEEETETQPCQVGPFVLTFDGRLDNRDTIAARSGISPNSLTPDPILILWAYEHSGDALFSDLIGEFALVLWDHSNCTLTFARSVDGARPLYYALAQKHLAWASTLNILLRNSETGAPINERYILDFLSSVPRSHHTPFANIEPVPPGSIVRFSNNALSKAQTIWQPPQPDSRIRPDAEYEEEFREKVTEAIAVRLRAKGVVFSELSGGLDSSTITLIADKIFSRNNRTPDCLRTISCVYNQSQTCDETPFIRVVESARKIPSIYVQEEEQEVTLGLHDATFSDVPNPLRLHAGRYGAYLRHMEDFGARVLLTGIGGDDLFGCNPDGTPLIADFLLKRQFRRVHQECKIWSRFSGRPYLKLLFAQALPMALDRNLLFQYKPHKLPEFLTRNCIAQINNKVHKSYSDTSLPMLPSGGAQRRSVHLLLDLIATGHFAAFPEIYFSHPYTHRPLLEFCLKTPLSQFVRPGEFRSLMRRALRGTLPPKILNRKTKTSMDEAILRAVQCEWDHIGDLRHWEVCQNGYVNPTAFQTFLQQLRIGIQAHTGFALKVLALEQWFRSIHSFNSRKTVDHSHKSIRPTLPHTIGASTHANQSP
jgi:asparagine synthase (glutamine-hydrolysing)